MDMIKRGLALLKEKADFRNLLGAQFAAQAGDGLVQGALATVIAFGGQKGFDLEGAKNPDDILRIALYIFIPYTLVSPFLGVVIDRWDRRQLLFVANGLRTVVVAAVAAFAFVQGNFNDVPDAFLFLSFLLTLSATRARRSPRTRRSSRSGERERRAPGERWSPPWPRRPPGRARRRRRLPPPE